MGRRVRRLALVAAALLCGCGVGDVPPRLVLLYAPCTVNRDFLAAYNPFVSYTPNLAKLAGEGVVFRNHWTEAGQSGIAYASIFAGTQAPGHGVFSHPTRIADSVYLITEAFADAGWDTWFWGGHGLASGRQNYAQGVPEANLFDEPLRAEDVRWRAILQRLENEPDYRALVVTNFTVTHAPYALAPLRAFCDGYPEQCREARTDAQGARRFARLHRAHHRQLANDFPDTVAALELTQGEVAEMARVLELLYKANIHRLDALFGAVFDQIATAGLLDEAVIAFTADHGELLYRDNALFKWTHGWELAPEVLAAPWILRTPLIPSERRAYAGVSRSIDVFPTLAGLAGVPLPAAKRNPEMGTDLAPALRGEAPAPDQRAFSHTVVQHPQALERIRDAGLWLRYHKGVNVGEMWASLQERDAQYKYRNLDGEHWGFQHFALRRDPEQRSDVFDAEAPVDRANAERLTRYREHLIAAWKAATAPAALDETDLDALRGLGYIE